MLFLRKAMRRYNIHIARDQFDDEAPYVESRQTSNGQWCKWEDVNQLRMKYNKLLNKYKRLKRDAHKEGSV